jgi:hypothetical protein
VTRFEPRFRFKSKERRYFDLFKHHAGNGFVVSRVHDIFMVYDMVNTENAYQCVFSHENVLRAYKALVWSCEGNVAEFLHCYAGRTPPQTLTEDNVSVLPLSPPDGEVRQFS